VSSSLYSVILQSHLWHDYVTIFKTKHALYIASWSALFSPPSSVKYRLYTCWNWCGTHCRKEYTNPDTKEQHPCYNKLLAWQWTTKSTGPCKEIFTSHVPTGTNKHIHLINMKTNLTSYHLNPNLWKHHLLQGKQQPLTVTMWEIQKCAVSCLSYNRFIPMLPGK